jgi:formylglycine-generating enzyme required for sulfatase activity
MDTREVTVADLRAFMAAEPDARVDVLPRDPSPDTEAHYCTFTAQPSGESEARPVNCVSWQTAERYCEWRGGSLPTEAQFEYVSGALRSALYIWGQDEAAICAAAVWGRGGRENTPIETAGVSSCLPETTALDGPVALMPDNLDITRVTDRISLDGGVVFDLAGNLQEWTRDWFGAQGHPCWSRPDTNIFVDPICTDPGTTGARSVRGGSWVQDRSFLRAAYRSSRAPDASQGYLVGFRCSRPAQ